VAYFPRNSSTSLCNFSRFTRISPAARSGSSPRSSGSILNLSKLSDSCVEALAFRGGGGGGETPSEALEPGEPRDATLFDLRIGNGGEDMPVAGCEPPGSKAGDGRRCVVFLLDRGGGGGIFFSGSVAAFEVVMAVCGGGGGGGGGAGSLPALSIKMEAGRLLLGEMRAGEVDDNDDFPPDLVRGLGGGGFTRMEDDLDRGSGASTSGTDSTNDFAGSLTSATLASECALSSGEGPPDSKTGSDIHSCLPEDTPRPTPPVAPDNECVDWPVNINSLKAFGSSECLLPSTLIPAVPPL
jgi:hypothetical protein